MFAFKIGACPALLAKQVARGCLVSTSCTFQDMQADYRHYVVKIIGEDISANFISKAKSTFAQAFAFAPALA